MAEKRDGVFLKTRSSRKVYIPIYVMIIVVFVVMGAIKFYGKQIDDFAFKVSLAFLFGVFAITEIHRLMNSYEINSHSLVHTKGILVKITRRVDLLAISDADYKQNPWQAIFGYGDVHVRSFSQDSTTAIKNINNPSHFIDVLEDRLSYKRGDNV